MGGIVDIYPLGVGYIDDCAPLTHMLSGIH